MDAQGSRAEALAVRHGRIVAVGSTTALRDLAGRGTQVIDLAGRTAIPGLVDPHLHLASHAPLRQMVDVRYWFTQIRSNVDVLAYPVDVLRDIGTCVSRRTLAGDVINPEEAIGVEDGLRAQTANAAHVGFVEREVGTLEVGKLADVTVLGADPFTFPAERFEELPVDLVMVGGQLAAVGA